MALWSLIQGVCWIKASKTLHGKSSVTDLPRQAAPPDLVPSDLPKARPSTFVIAISLLIYSPSLVRWRGADYFLEVSLILHFFLKSVLVQLATFAEGWLGSRMQAEILASSKSQQLPPPPCCTPLPCNTRAIPSIPGWWPHRPDASRRGARFHTDKFGIAAAFG